MTSYPHIASRIFNTPLMITPEKGHAIVSALSDRLGIASIAAPAPQMVFDASVDADTEGYQVVASVAVIGITGTLVAKSSWMNALSGMTGYDAIRLAYSQALSDSNVKAIVLDCDSPGGECAGVFDCADAIFEGRSIKPTYAILSEMACSAAYLLASSASKITVPRTGITGSIGVITMHTDMSKALEKAGIDVTIIQFGAQKADGTPTMPLPADVRARIQAEVDVLGELFVTTVARNRGLTADQVRAMEAGVFLGVDGVRNGLADAVASPHEAFQTIVRHLS